MGYLFASLDSCKCQSVKIVSWLKKCGICLIGIYVAWSFFMDSTVEDSRALHNIQKVKLNKKTTKQTDFKKTKEKKTIKTRTMKEKTNEGIKEVTSGTNNKDE